MKNLETILKSRLFNFVFVFSAWLFSISQFSRFGLLARLDPNILLLLHLGAFFFALTTSPVTWIIKGFGIEIGHNAPDHFQVDKIVEEGGRKTTIIIRDFSRSRSEDEMNKILSKQTPRRG